MNSDLKATLAHKKGAGSPRCISFKELHRRVRAVEFKDKKNIHSLARKVGVPKTTLGTKCHMKPMLTPKNKREHVAFFQSNVDQENCFVTMLNRVDIDKKRFYLTQVNTSYLLVPGEMLPH